MSDKNTTKISDSKELENKKNNENEKKKKKISLDDLKINDFITEIDLDDMQFLNTAGG